MSDKTTSDLRQELMEDNSIDTYLQGNAALFVNQDVVALLTELYEQKHLTKAALARQAGMSEVYLHQVFAGRRNPSRDRLLCLCIGLEATVEETQQLLRAGGVCPALSPGAAGCHHSPCHCPRYCAAPGQ